MSLDITLTEPRDPTPCDRAAKLLREHGFEDFAWELEARHDHGPRVLWEGNCTHNLTTMAAEAGLYQLVWRGDEIGITKAMQLTEPLTKGIRLMENDPERFKKHNPDNGWGTYESLLNFLRQLKNACQDWPHADVSRCR